MPALLSICPAPGALLERAGESFRLKIPAANLKTYKFKVIRHKLRTHFDAPEPCSMHISGQVNR